MSLCNLSCIFLGTRSIGVARTGPFLAKLSEPNDMVKVRNGFLHDWLGQDDQEDGLGSPMATGGGWKKAWLA